LIAQDDNAYALQNCIWHFLEIARADPQYFDPIECELPVDRRVSANWNNAFGRLKMLDFQTKNTSHVAKKARSFARENGFSPSVFDAILFYSGIE
jgi:hypothetical protein